jgi:hypothetical protein
MIVLAVAPIPAAGKAEKRTPAKSVKRPIKLTPKMKRAMKRARRRSALRRAYLRSTEAQEARQMSRRRFKNLSREESLQLARGEFPAVFTRPLSRGPELAPGQSIDEFVGDYAYFVKTGNPDNPRERTLVQSMLPVSVVDPGSGQRELVSTELEQQGSDIAPRRSASPVRIPRNASGGVRFERSDVRMSLVGATESRASVDADKATYTDATVDTDYTVAALPNGVETFLQLRSEDSPEEIRFRFDVPDGAELRLTPNAIGKAHSAPGAEIVRDGRVIQSVAPPASLDADGQPVPTRFAIDGNDLVMRVQHRGGDFMYPILADPYVTTFGNVGNPSWGYWESNGQFYEYDCTWNSNCGSGTGLGGTGLYVHASPGYYNQNEQGQWWFQAPRGAHIIGVDWNRLGTYAANSCVYGNITDAAGNAQGNTAYYCDPYGTNVYRDHRQCTNGTTSCNTSGSSPGNYARFGLIMYNGTYGAWAHLGNGLINLWEGAAPYFKSMQPVNPAQWDEPNKRTRWLKSGEIFSYQYNVHDDGLGLDFVDDNNFRDSRNWGQSTRSQYIGGCDNPVSPSCLYDYVTPRPDMSWDANETSTFPEGVTDDWAHAIDNVGNHSTKYSWRIRVDRTPPKLTTVGGSLAGLDQQVAAAGAYDLFATARDDTTTTGGPQQSGIKSMNIQFIDPSGVVRWSHPYNGACADANCFKDDWVSFDTNDFAVQYGFGKWTFRITAHDGVDLGVQRDVEVTFNRPADYEQCMEEEIDRYTGLPDPAYCGKHDRDETSNLETDAEPAAAPLPSACTDCSDNATDPDAQLDSPTDAEDPLYKLANPATTKFGISEGATRDNFDGVVETMRSPFFKQLKVKRWRRILPYNLVDLPSTDRTRAGWEEQYATAKAKGIQLMVSFDQPHDINTGAELKYAGAPSRAKYMQKVTAFMNQYKVNIVSPFNEPNYSGKGIAGSGGAKRLALLTMEVSKKVCNSDNNCTVVAGDLAQRGDWRRYLRDLTDEINRLASTTSYASTARPKKWGFHPYTDVSYKRSDATDDFFEILMQTGRVPSNSTVWFTEVGSRLDIRGTGKGGLAQNAEEQRQEVAYLVDTLIKRKMDASHHQTHPRVERMYYYHFWTPQQEDPNTRNPDGTDKPDVDWDSGLTTNGGDGPVDFDDLRPSYGEYFRVTTANGGEPMPFPDAGE